MSPNPQTPHAQVFRSKRDAWLTIVLAVTMAVMVTAWLLVALLAELGPIATVVGLVVGLSAVLLIASVLIRTQYVIDDGRLRIYAGPFRWQLAFADILRVEETSDPSSAPALSLDRLRITYRHIDEERAILISPRDKAAFVALLPVNVKLLR